MKSFLIIYLLGAIAAIALTIYEQVKEIITEGDSVGENLLLYATMGLISWFGFAFLLLYYYYNKNHNNGTAN